MATATAIWPMEWATAPNAPATQSWFLVRIRFRPMVTRIGQNSFQADGHQNRTGAAGGRIENGAEITCKHRTQEDPGRQDHSAFFGAHGEHGEHRDDVGKTQLHAGDGDQSRDLGLDHKDGQRDGRQ